jgi:glucosamine kinase
LNPQQILVAGVDGGGTRTRLVLADGTARTLASVEGEASAVDPRNPAHTVDVIARLLADALDTAGHAGAPVQALCAGVAGTGRDHVQRALENALEAREIADRILVTTDAQIALDDAFGERAGVLLISGTGSIAYGRGPTGDEGRCGGWGPHLGDEGGALWLARRALSAATASVDGREPDTALVGALLTATDCAAPGDLIAWAAHATNADIAALATVVMTAAEAGDLRATTLTTMASEELALHVRTLARKLFGDERAAVRVALSGGLLARGSLMRRLVRHRLKSAVPGATVSDDDIDPARGAVRFALRHVHA